MNFIKRFCHNRKKKRSLREWAVHRSRMENALDKILGLSGGKTDGQRKHH